MRKEHDKDFNAVLLEEVRNLTAGVFRDITEQLRFLEKLIRDCVADKSLSKNEKLDTIIPMYHQAAAWVEMAQVYYRTAENLAGSQRGNRVESRARFSRVVEKARKARFNVVKRFAKFDKLIAGVVGGEENVRR